MKFGQAMSIFESALPDELIGPHRDALTKLQDSAPPMSQRMLEQVLTEDLGSHWRSMFTSFDTTPVASASIGQVHRAVWSGSPEVPVKVQYPGAATALPPHIKHPGRRPR